MSERESSLGSVWKDTTEKGREIGGKPIEIRECDFMSLVNPQWTPVYMLCSIVHAVSDVNQVFFFHYTALGCTFSKPQCASDKNSQSVPLNCFINISYCNNSVEFVQIHFISTMHKAQCFCMGFFAAWALENDRIYQTHALKQSERIKWSGGRQTQTL